MKKCFFIFLITALYFNIYTSQLEQTQPTASINKSRWFTDDNGTKWYGIIIAYNQPPSMFELDERVHVRDKDDNGKFKETGTLYELRTPPRKGSTSSQPTSCNSSFGNNKENRRPISWQDWVNNPEPLVSLMKKSPLK